MLGYKRARIATKAAGEAITRAREAVTLGREALELYRNARRSEEAVLDIVEQAVESGDLEQIRETVETLRAEHDRYRAREDALDAAHLVNWKL